MFISITHNTKQHSLNTSDAYKHISLLDEAQFSEKDDYFSFKL